MSYVWYYICYLYAVWGLDSIQHSIRTLMCRRREVTRRSRTRAFNKGPESNTRSPPQCCIGFFVRCYELVCRCYFYFAAPFFVSGSAVSLEVWITYQSKHTHPSQVKHLISDHIRQVSRLVKVIASYTASVGGWWAHLFDHITNIQVRAKRRAISGDERCIF